MKKIKVHVVYEHSSNSRPYGAAYIRLLLPLNHPLNADTFEVSRGTTYAGADVVIVDRMWRPDNVSIKMAEDLVKSARSDSACLIYSIDDNLLDLKLDGPARRRFATELLMAVRYFAREADGVIVSTDSLRDRLERLNRRIVVVPNALDERLWGDRSFDTNFVRTDGGRKVIGFMGTHTHDADLMMILQALRETMRRHIDSVELQLIGGVADRALIQAFDGLPIKVLDIVGNVEYPAFARWMAKNVKWDLGIAPLEENSFTRCKSDIKFLDSSALGIPGIYSRFVPYEKAVRHLETGYLASNDTRSWSEAFERLLTEDSLRRSLAEQAREYVLSNRTLKQRAHEWRDAVLSIANRQNASANSDAHG